MTEAATIIRGLGGNPATGMCCCPAHDDQDPSLHVTQGTGGKVLFKCHAGCSQDDVIGALRQLGLWQSRDGTASRGENESKPSEGDAADRDELKPFKILRAALQAKQGQPTDYLKGRGITIVPECALILPAKKTAQYIGPRLPAMVAPIVDEAHLIGAHATLLTRDANAKAESKIPRRVYGELKGGYVICGETDPAKPLIVGEGIETTLAAMQLSGGFPGIAAVSASNMPAVRPPKCAEVIIAADYDAAGRRAAAQLAERLEYEGVKVRIALPPVEGEDWNDRLRVDEAKAETEWESALASGDPDAEPQPIAALDESEFLALTFPRRKLLLEPWLMNPGLGMIHAARGAGKTWFGLGVGKAVAGGQDLLGWRCPDCARVLYVDGELPGAALQERLRKFRASPPGMFNVLTRDTFLLRRQTMPDIGTPEGRHELDQIIEQCDPKLIILDSISTLVRSGIENEAESWAPVQDWLMKHRWRGRTLWFIHHEGRSGKPRGTSKREDLLETMIGLKKTDGSDEATDDTSYELTFTKGRDLSGRDMEPLQLRLSLAGGQVRWTAEKVRNVRNDKIREMLDEGMSNAAIGKELGLTKARIGQIARKLKSD